MILTSNNDEFILDAKDLIITSKKSYYVNSDYNFTSFILTGENIDEIISFNMRKNFFNIEKLSITMKFRRAQYF